MRLSGRRTRDTLTYRAQISTRAARFSTIAVCGNSLSSRVCGDGQMVAGGVKSVIDFSLAVDL